MKEHHPYSEHNYQNNAGRGDSGHFSLSRADMHVQLPLIVGLVALILLSVFVSKDGSKRGKNGMTWGLFTFLVPVIAVPVYIVIILTENNMNAKVARITAQNPRFQNLQSSTTAQSPPSNDVLTVTRTTPSNNAEQPTPVETGQASEELIGPKEADPKESSNEVNQVTKMSNQFCTSCGAKNSLKAIFCNICGNKVVL